MGLIKRSKLRENRVDKIMKIIIYKKCLTYNIMFKTQKIKFDFCSKEHYKN